MAVAKAMVESFEPWGASVQLVEVFIYPGDGDVIITAMAVGRSLDVIKSGCQTERLNLRLMHDALNLQEGTKKVAEVGLHYVQDSWIFIRNQYPLIVPRKNPRDKDYDIHINMPPTLDVPVVCWR